MWGDVDPLLCHHPLVVEEEEAAVLNPNEEEEASHMLEMYTCKDINWFEIVAVVIVSHVPSS